MPRIVDIRILLVLLILTLCGCVHNKQNISNQQNYYDSSKAKARENASLVFNYLRQGYTDYAQEKLHLALAQAPDDPVVLDIAGYFYEKTGRIKLANRYYKQAVIAAPYSGIAKNNYGAFLCRNGYYKASIPYFLQASTTPRTPVTREALENAQYCRMKIKTGLGGGAS
jgi:type IV pilus assembly protein PilF